MTYLRGDDAPAGSGSAGYDGLGFTRSSMTDQLLNNYPTFEKELTPWGIGISTSDVTTSTGNSKFTANTTGDYWVYLAGYFKGDWGVSTSNGQEYEFEIRVNGSVPSHRIAVLIRSPAFPGAIGTPPRAASNRPPHVAQGLLSLTANDEVEIYGRENTPDTNMIISTAFYMSLILLKAAA